MTPLDDYSRRIRETIATCGTLTEAMVDQIEADVRRMWGGNRYHLPKADYARLRAAILRDWRNGERIPLLVRRYQVSRAYVYKVLNERPGTE